MTVDEFCNQRMIENWQYYNIVERKNAGFYSKHIAKSLGISVQTVNSVYNWHINQIKIRVVEHSTRQYWLNEQEMIIQDYDNCTLEGKELEILNGIK